MTAPTVDAAAGLRRITRRDLAENVQVWRATAAMFGVVSAATVAMLIVGEGEHQSGRIVFLVCALAVALAVLRGEPPATNTIRNHAVIACTYVFATAGLFVFQPAPEAALAISIFIGPLAAARLDRRPTFFAHLGAATAILAIGAVAGGLAGALSDATLVAMLILALGIWCLGFSCLVTLEAAEAQGDDLEHLVRLDPLTGVGNRRMLVERLGDEVERHRTAGQPLSVIALDLTGFKNLDDTLGHVAGDELLREVSAALVGLVRPGDTVIRQGGDEFCLILVETSAEQAEHVVDAVRAALRAIEGDGSSLAGGIGVATFPQDATTRGELLEVADRRLVRAKRGAHPT